MSAEPTEVEASDIRVNMVTRREVARADRAWRAVVFSRSVHAAVMAWLCLCLAAFAAAVFPALTHVGSAVLRYIMPAGLTAITWLTASSYALTSAAAFSRREVGTGVWMMAWTLVLLLMGASGVYWLLDASGMASR